MAHFSFSLSVTCFLFLWLPLFGFVEEYLLPKDHPIKQTLDVLFSSQVISSKSTLEKAGFQMITRGHYSDTVVATHPNVPGYFFKLYTDDQEGIDELEKLMHRISGALLAKQIIANHGWESYFKVPQKWLYHLENKPYGKQVILIAEDMDIYSKNDNLKKWASKKVTKEKLDILYIFLTEGGFADSIYYFNLPFSKDGRWALIDTEKYHTWPIPYHLLTKRLLLKMQIHWTHLTEN